MVRKFKNIIRKNAVDTQELLFVQPIKEFDGKKQKNISQKKLEEIQTDDSLQTEMFIEPEGDESYMEIDEQQTSTNEDHYNELRSDAKEKVDIELEAYKNQKKLEFDQELAELKSKVLEEAREEGLKEGLAEYKEKSAEVLAKINEIVAFRNKALFYFEPFLIDLATAISARIIDQQVKLDTMIFRKMFAEALNNITDKEKIVIQVNPEDAPEIEKYQEAFPKKFQEFKQIEIQEMPSMQRGGCTIETKLGYIDGSIETKLSLLKETMEDLFNEEKERLGAEAVLIPDEDTVNAIEVPEMPEPEEALIDQEDEKETTIAEEEPVQDETTNEEAELVDPVENKEEEKEPEINYVDSAADLMLDSSLENDMSELMEDVDADVFDQAPMAQVNESDISDNVETDIDPNLKTDDIFIDKTDELPITEEQLEKDFEDFDFDEDFS